MLNYFFIFTIRILGLVLLSSNIQQFSKFFKYRIFSHEQFRMKHFCCFRIVTPSLARTIWLITDGVSPGESQVRER